MPFKGRRNQGSLASDAGNTSRFNDASTILAANDRAEIDIVVVVRALALQIVIRSRDVHSSAARFAIDRTSAAKSRLCRKPCVSGYHQSPKASSEAIKKPGVVTHLWVFDHAGSLVNGPPGYGLPFISFPTDIADSAGDLLTLGRRTDEGNDKLDIRGYRWRMRADRSASPHQSWSDFGK